MAISKTERRSRIKKGIRANISGTADVPRISVFKSNKAIYAQIIDDVAGTTIAYSSSIEIGKKGVNIEVSKEVGKALAEKAKGSKVEKVVFDRNGYPYHGKIKALADGAREGGLKF